MGVAADALIAFVRGEESRGAEIGALLVAEHLLLIRSFLTRK